jgi:segregation and condensation protein B
MSKRTRKKQSEDRVEAIVREILPPAAEVLAGGGRAPDDSVEELGDALDALDDGRAGVDAGAEGQAERHGWADHVDPAGLASEDEAESAGAERGVVIYDADAEDRDEERARLRAEGGADGGDAAAEEGEVAPGGQPRELAELMAVCEALIFVSDEPLSAKALADVLKEERGWVQVAVEELAKEFNERNGGLMLREVAGGWQLATRPEHHDSIRAFLKSKPSAKLSLAALETLAVIAYKQPITVPEILEIRGVQSSSAIKTLLDKRLIVAKGRKETVGRPMMYGTSKEFLMQFGLRDLGELPNVEDFEDLAAGGEA